MGVTAKGFGKDKSVIAKLENQLKKEQEQASKQRKGKKPAAKEN